MSRFLILLLLSFPVVSLAQRSHTGILGGGTLGNQSPSFFERADPVINFHLGAYRTVPVAKYLSVEAGMYAVQKGYQYRDVALNMTTPMFSSGSKSSRTTLSYISLPIALRKHLDDNLSVHAGGYAAGLLYSQVKSELLTGETITDYAGGIVKQNPLFSRYDLGLQAGLRYVFPIHLVLNASYEHGLVGIMRNVVNDGPKNRSVSVSVGYQW